MSHRSDLQGPICSARRNWRPYAQYRDGDRSQRRREPRPKPDPGSLTALARPPHEYKQIAPIKPGAFCARIGISEPVYLLWLGHGCRQDRQKTTSGSSSVLVTKPYTQGLFTLYLRLAGLLVRWPCRKTKTSRSQHFALTTSRHNSMPAIETKTA